MINEQDISKSTNTSQDLNHQSDDIFQNQEENYSKTREIWLFIWETAKIIIISLAIIVPIRYYLIQPFFVKGASMEPSFQNGDYLLIDEISYRFKEPQRGDVVVFRYPENTSLFFIKRIIGLSGETIEIKNGRVTISKDKNSEDMILEESYLPSGLITSGNTIVELGEGEYYVLGDNRPQSSDSRRWGVLEKKFITGKAFVRLWPINMISKVEAVTY